MPVADLQYFVPAGSNAFTVETPCGNYSINFPLGAAEPTHFTVEAPFVQTTVNYSRPAANTLLSYRGSNCYFVTDDSFRSFGSQPGPVSTWVRQWSTVPAQWQEPQEYAYTYPASSGGAIGGVYNVTAITASAANVVLTTATTGITAGEGVFVSVKFVNSGLSVQTSFYTGALAVTNTTLTIGLGTIGFVGSFTNVSGIVTEAVVARAQPRTIPVASLIQHDYALSSTSSLDTDLPLNPVFTPIDNATGAETSELSTTTTPLASQYAQLVVNSSLICVECTRRRYLGNIYERATRYVPAR